jgi:chaperone modulatory protein CbpM
MTETYSPAQVLVRVTQLTESRLTAYVETEAVRPIETELGPQFVESDLARLSLLCEFEDLYEMSPEALAVLITVIDQLHAARQDRDRLLAAIRAEPAEVQSRIAAVLAQVSPRSD